MFTTYRLTLMLFITFFLLPLSVALAQNVSDDISAPEMTAQKEATPSPEISSDTNPGLQAPTISGLTGLFRLVTGDIGRPHTFRVGLHTEAFKSSNFLVEGDSNSRFIGTLAVSYTPWSYSEFFINVNSSANNNDRTEPGRLDQSVIFALGDLSFGGKGQYPITPYLSLGGNLAINLLNSVGGLSFSGDSTGFFIGLLSSFDLDPLAQFPLRFHVNFGYQLDNSNNLVTFDNYPLSSLQVEKFALGIKPSRLQTKFGVDLPLRRWVGFGLTPIVELAMDTGMGDTDPDFDNARIRSTISASLQRKLGRAPTTEEIRDEIDGRNAVWMTLGFRVNPVQGVNVELASDIGIVSPGFGYGPPVVPWNFILGLSYAYDPAPPTRVVMRETVKTVVKEVAEKTKGGKLRGRVINANTLEPVEGAIVTLPGKDLTGLSTDPDGSFLTYELPPGKHPIMVRHPDFQPAKLIAQIKLGATVVQDVKLIPAPPKVGKVSGRITDAKGNAIAASVSVSGVESKQVNTDANGNYAVQLPPGAYTITATAEGYLRKVHLLTLAGGTTVTADFSLSQKSKRPLARMTKKEIIIKKQIHFATAGATILPDSQQLLDTIADILLANQQIKKIEIGGHTDNVGKPEYNEQLSQARADAVKDYLIKCGVAPERLEAKGYGANKPKVPNITPANRARNRRVEFLILEQ